jgi:AcrR family transcriptional regulator
MQLDIISEAEAPESRREALLEAAVGVFARYGFRKTSMDEVARAAGVSRQGLYLQFADKESLFREAVAYKLNRQLTAALLALSHEHLDLETRLIAACDEWAGRAVGTMGGDAADLMCASTSLAGATLADYHAQFENALARTIGASPLVSFCASSGFTAHDVARALHATARGLKHSCESRQQFLQGITVAARLFCAPLQCVPQE